MLPTFHEDDHRCHYKDKKLKSAGRFKGAGCTIFCSTLWRLQIQLPKRCILTRDVGKGKMLYAVVCTRLSSANVKSQGLFRRNRIQRGGAMNWGPHRNSLVYLFA